MGRRLRLAAQLAAPWKLERRSFPERRINPKARDGGGQPLAPFFVAGERTPPLLAIQGSRRKSNGTAPVMVAACLP